MFLLSFQKYVHVFAILCFVYYHKIVLQCFRLSQSALLYWHSKKHVSHYFHNNKVPSKKQMAAAPLILITVM